MPRKEYPAAEAARMLGVSLDTLRRWDRDGLLAPARANQGEPGHAAERRQQRPPSPEHEAGQARAVAGPGDAYARMHVAAERVAGRGLVRLVAQQKRRG